MTQFKVGQRVLITLKEHEPVVHEIKSVGAEGVVCGAVYYSHALYDIEPVKPAVTPGQVWSTPHGNVFIVRDYKTGVFGYIFEDGSGGALDGGSVERSELQELLFEAVPSV